MIPCQGNDPRALRLVKGCSIGPKLESHTEGLLTNICLSKRSVAQLSAVPIQWQSTTPFLSCVLIEENGFKCYYISLSQRGVRKVERLTGQRRAGGHVGTTGKPGRRLRLEDLQAQYGLSLQVCLNQYTRDFSSSFPRLSCISDGDTVAVPL